MTRFPLPLDDSSHRERGASIEQCPLSRAHFERRFDEDVHPPLASQAQIPRLDFVGARTVGPEASVTAADHLERGFAHVLLETPTAHVPGRAAILGHEQLGPLVAIRGADHTDDGRERGALPVPAKFRQAVEHLSSLAPLFHDGLTLVAAHEQGARLLRGWA